ncbi:MAG: anti-sigma factor [Proteobacteria bacterium]|nr:anti-sigma factor [Pseudomonadota bacterium]
MTDPTLARAEELLADRALEGLTPAEVTELERLGADDDSFELAAAALELALYDHAPMPASVAARVRVTLTDLDEPAAPRATPAREPAVVPVVPLIPRDPTGRRLQLTAWLAAAAGLVLAIGAWLWAAERPPRIEFVKADTTTGASPAVASRPSEDRARLLATAKDVTTLAWTATDDPSARGASGDVVWSPARQQGYMRFVGLAPNDRAAVEYQLWIFDASRDAAFPVDGGVFDVTQPGEVIVPITARLRVDKLALFAVTVEQPGGVVVSKRERIVVTAKPG